MRILSYCLLSNHWHLVLWPERDGALRKWQINRARVGYGHLYQGRYKSFPIEGDEHFYQVARYVERNALRANLVRSAEQWRYGSLWRRIHGTAEERRILSDWPLPRPRSWLQYVNRPQSEAELEAIRRSVRRGRLRRRRLGPRHSRASRSGIDTSAPRPTEGGTSVIEQMDLSRLVAPNPR